VYREQRRSLIVASIETAQDPVQAGHSDGGADTWVNRVLADGGAEMCKPDSAVQGQPTGELVLILEEERFDISPYPFALAERRVAAVTGDDSEELIVAGAEHLEAGAGVVLSTIDGQRCDPAEVIGAAIVIGNDDPRV